MHGQNAVIGIGKTHDPIRSKIFDGFPGAAEIASGTERENALRNPSDTVPLSDKRGFIPIVQEEHMHLVPLLSQQAGKMKESTVGSSDEVPSLGPAFAKE
jgi:hypothetical protein